MTTYGADGVEIGPTTGGDVCTQVYNYRGEPKFLVQTSGLNDDSVTNAILRDSGPLSVIGRSANSTGDPADISATAASDQVLRESGNVLGFGTVNTGGMAANAVTDTILRNSGALSVIGRSANSTGDPADISATAAAYQVLQELSSALVWQLPHLPLCLVTNSTTFSHNSSGNFLGLTWDTDTTDPHAFHDTSSNTGRLTIPTGFGGTYIVIVGVVWDSNTTGSRALLIDHKNSAGTTLARGGSNQAASASGRQITVAMFNVAATDYFTAFAQQDSGGTRTIDLTKINGGFYGCVRVGA